MGSVAVWAGWAPGTVARAAVLAVLLHDVGKLTARSGQGQGWQTWAAIWQTKIGHPLSPALLVAHTDYNSDDETHRQIESEMKRRPAHALEGALAAAPLLAEAFRVQPALLKAAFSAIARHHGAFTKSFCPYELVGSASAAVRQTLSLAEPHTGGLTSVQLRQHDDPAQTSIRRLLVDSSNDNELLAYMLLARALRRADQLGTERGTMNG